MTIRERLNECLNMFLHIMKIEVVDPVLNYLKEEKISDTTDKRLEKAVSRWLIHFSNSSIITA